MDEIKENTVFVIYTLQFIHSTHSSVEPIFREPLVSARFYIPLKSLY